MATVRRARPPPSHFLDIVVAFVRVFAWLGLLAIHTWHFALQSVRNGCLLRFLRGICNVLRSKITHNIAGICLLAVIAFYLRNTIVRVYLPDESACLHGGDPPGACQHFPNAPSCMRMSTVECQVIWCGRTDRRTLLSSRLNRLLHYKSTPIPPPVYVTSEDKCDALCARPGPLIHPAYLNGTISFVFLLTLLLILRYAYRLLRILGAYLVDEYNKHYKTVAAETPLVAKISSPSRVPIELDDERVVPLTKEHRVHRTTQRRIKRTEPYAVPTNGLLNRAMVAILEYLAAEENKEKEAAANKQLDEEDDVQPDKEEVKVSDDAVDVDVNDVAWLMEKYHMNYAMAATLSAHMKTVTC